VSAKFYLTFTDSREQAYRIIQMRHLSRMNQLQHFFTSSFRIGTPSTALQEKDSRRAKLAEAFLKYV